MRIVAFIVLGLSIAALALWTLFDPTEQFETPVSDQESQRFVVRILEPTGPLEIPDRGHSATLLTDGRVLVAGGKSEAWTLLGAASIYDPEADTFAAIGPLNTARENHSATLLQDGRVLVVGGENSEDRLASAEIFDPATNRWTETSALSEPRVFHSATLLADGRVLVAGGSNFESGPTNTVEIFDPSEGRWRSAPPLKYARSDHSASVLPDGSVLIVGGLGPIGPGNVIDGEARDLATGETLQISGLNTAPLGTLSSVEIFDPNSGAWQEGPELRTPRSAHRSVGMTDGQVIVVSGLSGTLGGIGVPPDMNVVPSIEAYDPEQSSWRVVGKLRYGREGHTASQLDDGRLLIVGGADGLTFFSRAEVLDPASGAADEPIDVGFKSFHHTATSTAAGLLVLDGKARIVTTP